MLDATKEVNTQGIGLGLHISKAIVDSFDGKITCWSQLKRGTKFTFTFCLSDPRTVIQVDNHKVIENPSLQIVK